MKQLAAIPEIHQARLVETLPEVLKLETEGKTFTTEPTPTPTVAPPVYQPIIKKDYLMVELINHRLGPDGQPLALSILFETLRKNPKYLEMEGIFRKSGSIEE